MRQVPGSGAVLLWEGLAATAVHTGAMVAVAGANVLLVYEVVGLRILCWVHPPPG